MKDTPVCQKSSSVTNEELKLELTVYGAKIKADKIEEIEKQVRSTIFSATPISTKVCQMGDKSLGMDEITIVPGEVYPEDGVRLVSVGGFHGRKLISNEFCCGTHAMNTEELKDFCITNVKLTGNNSYCFYGIAGDAAVQAHHRGEQILHDVLQAKHDLENQKEGIESTEARVLRLKNVVLDSDLQIPYCIKQKSVEILNELTTLIKNHMKESLREVMEIEMKTLLEQKPAESHRYIVHFLESSSLVKDVKLQNATKFCTDRPIIVISLTNGRIKARCCVPKSFVNDNFDATKWLAAVADIFKTGLSPVKASEPEEVCNMRERKVSQATVEAQIELALSVASEFAENYLR
jgi:alanyl-tRNA synthetase